MNNSLLESYTSIKDYYRYSENEQKSLLEQFTSTNASSFIENYFGIAGKESLFNFDFIKKYRNKNKNKDIHTVNLFLLGLHLKNIILSSSSIIKEHFEYIWFLTCLYHDVACVIENNRNNKYFDIGNYLDLNFYLGKYNVIHNVYNHNWKNIKYLNYSQYLIKNYFKYRLEHMNCIDHGIIGGYLLYDGLMKNYDSKFDETNKENYNKFHTGGLEWDIEHLELYAIAAHAIIEHNIWFAIKEDDKNNYKKYGLDELICDEQLNIEKSPLLFYLGLLDSIEPLKLIANKESSASDILRLISIEVKNKHIHIKYDDNLKKGNYIDFDKWIENIASTIKWLDVRVETKNKNEILIKVK